MTVVKSKIKAVPADKYTGYKSINKAFSNSSFWMDDDFMDNELTVGKPKADVVKLAGYKRAIGNFVRIVTGKDDIKVSYSSGEQSYTDGKNVVISAKLDEKEFDATVGLALHEGSHVALTDFKVLNVVFNGTELDELYAKHKDSIGKTTFQYRIKTLVNILEDRRIDRYIYDSAPGYQGYYQSLYDKYFNSKEIDNALLSGTMAKEDWDCYEFHLTNLTNPNRQLSQLKALRSIWKTIDLANINRLTSTYDVLQLAVNVYEMICDAIGWEVNAEKEDDSKINGNNPQSGDNGDDSSEADDVDDSNEADDDDNLDMPIGNGNATASASDSKSQAKAEKEAKALSKAIKKQKDFLEGNISKKKLSKTEARQVNAAADASMEYASVGGDVEGYTGKGKVECMIVRGVNKEVVESGLMKGHWQNPENTKRDMRIFNQSDYVAEGIALGTMLGKKLKTRDEDRSLKTTRLESGRIDRRLIAELGFGNDRVFNNVIHNTVTPSLIHISIDASGSMYGSKWSSSVKTAVAIAKAASMIASLDVVISLRGSYFAASSGSWAGIPLMWIVFDSRKDKFSNCIDRFYGIQVDGGTPEGLCLQAVMKDILNSANGKDAYFINLCDGEPHYSNSGYTYSGRYAETHTATQVEKMRKSGIKVLGYYISESIYKSSAKAFKNMYGNDSEFIDTNSLTQLSISLNRLFVRK